MHGHRTASALSSRTVRHCTVHFKDLSAWAFRRKWPCNALLSRPFRHQHTPELLRRLLPPPGMSGEHRGPCCRVTCHLTPSIVAARVVVPARTSGFPHKAALDAGDFHTFRLGTYHHQVMRTRLPELSELSNDRMHLERRSHELRRDLCPRGKNGPPRSATLCAFTAGEMAFLGKHLPR